MTLPAHQVSRPRNPARQRARRRHGFFPEGFWWCSISSPVLATGTIRKGMSRIESTTEMGSSWLGIESRIETGDVANCAKPVRLVLGGPAPPVGLSHERCTVGCGPAGSSLPTAVQPIPRPRDLAKVHSIRPTRASPRTSRLRCRSNDGVHGTRLKPSPSSIIANRPDARSRRWR